MHLVRGMSTLSTKKRRQKKKEFDSAQLERDWRAYNKDMRRKNMHKCQFDTLQDYVDYRMGTMKKKKTEFVPYEPKESKPTSSTANYPSLSTESIPGSGAKKESPVYSGDYIVGIATMHKSNIVPVGRGDDPKHYAAMRRN
jgi:hypothetical protein